MATKQADIETHLNICLEWIQSGQETLESALDRFADEAEGLRPLLEAAVWMQAHGDLFAPDQRRLRASKRRLVSRIKEEQAARASTNWQTRLASLFRRNTFAFQAAITIVLVLALAFGSFGVAQASQGTIPGDSLYGLKLTLEDAELTLSLSPLQDARLHIKFIGRRAVEIQSLVMENRLEFLNQAVARYQNQIDQALQSLKAAAQRLPAQSAQLASELQATLISQTPLFSILAETVPADFRADFTNLQAVTDEGISASNAVISTPEGATQVAASATPTPNPSPTVPPNATATVPATPTPESTAVPLALPSEDSSIQPSDTPTPSPTAITREEDDDDGVVPTKKPTKTPKPTKPPKPTKTPKIKDKD